MLKILKTKITKHWVKRVAATEVSQAPKLPFEILFRILDELSAEDTQEAIITIIAAGNTCRAMASYRRALLFHSTEVHWHLLSATEVHRDHRKKTPARFLSLTRRCPSILQVVQNLSLCGKQGNGPGRRSAWTSQQKEWVDVLSLCFPSLRAVMLDFSRWGALSRELQEAILRMLLRSNHLETLVINILECPPQILQYCPSTLKYFVYINQAHTEGESPMDPPVRDRQSLEGFTYAGVCRALFQEYASASPASQILAHKSLKHMELWSTEGLAIFPTYSPLVQQSSSTLQCLHLISPQFMYHDLVPPLPTLNLGSLQVLRLFEVGVNIWQLAASMRWISTSVFTTSERRVGDLVVVINVQQQECWAHPRPPAYTQRLHDSAADSWRTTIESEAPYWLGLHNVNAFAFSEIITSFGHRAKDGLRLPLQPQIGVEATLDNYASLVQEICVCSRVRDVVADGSVS